MPDNKPKNIAASVHARLLNLAKQRREDFNLTLTRYAVERLLYRLSKSKYRDQYVLKGAMLFTVWSSQPYRATRDVDFLGQGYNSVEFQRQVFSEICTISDEEDGMVFNPESVRAEEIIEDAQYHGIRVNLEVKLGSARINVQADIGFGDAVTPGPAVIEFPTLLEHKNPTVSAYPRETAIAEKYQVMVELGIANSRMKDFYDIWVLARSFEYEGEKLALAISNTFERRNTAIPKNPPLAFTEAFYKDGAKLIQWNAFVKKNTLLDHIPSLQEVCEFLNEFLWPPTTSLRDHKTFRESWPAGGGWTPKSR